MNSIVDKRTSVRYGGLSEFGNRRHACPFIAYVDFPPHHAVFLQTLDDIRDCRVVETRARGDAGLLQFRGHIYNDEYCVLDWR